LTDVYNAPLPNSATAFTITDYTSDVNPEQNMNGEILFAAKLCNESYLASADRKQYILKNGSPSDRLYKKLLGFPENVTIYQPILQDNERLPSSQYFYAPNAYYIVLTGTNTLYDLVKDLDIMSDYALHPDLFTAFSNDVATIIGFLRSSVFNLDSQQIVFVGHSLGCSYIQSIIHNMCNVEPYLTNRIKEVYYFNPYVLVTDIYKNIEQKCLADTNFRDKFIISIVDHDYASVVFRTKPYGNVFVYPNNVAVTDNEFLNDLLETVAGTVVAITRQQYLNYQNHYINNWTTLYPAETIHKMTDLSSISIQSLKSAEVINYADRPIALNIKTPTSNTNSELLADSPARTHTDSEYIFTVVKGFTKDYFLYWVSNVSKVAFPYTITSTVQGSTYSQDIWFLHMETVSNVDRYGLLTIDLGGNKHYNIVNNNANFSELFNQYLYQVTESEFTGYTQASAIERTRFIITEPTLLPAVADRRTSEPNNLDGNWQLINKRTSGYLLYTSQQYTIQEGHINTTHNLVGSNENVSSPDDSVWTMSHNSGTNYYTFTNTQTTAGTAVNLGDSWGAAEYWRVNTNSIWGQQSDYKNEASNTISNNQIYVDFAKHYNATSTTYGNYDVFLYVLLNGKKQYIVNYNDHGNDHSGWSYLFIVSEDHFDPTTTNNIKDYRAPQDATADEKYNQFVWTLTPTGGSQIGTI
jgi:hypothetical protein